MKLSIYAKLTVCIALSLLHSPLSGKKKLRRHQKQAIPEVSVEWEKDSTKKYLIKKRCLRSHPFFETYNQRYSKKHALPKGKITYRNKPQQFVNGATLGNLIEELIEELKTKRRNFTHFTVVTRRNFNRHRKKCGVLILKFKEHPFIVKLFMETPKTFVNPNCKGFEPIFLFYLGGGINRHLSGFTRIKNLEAVRKRITSNKSWASKVDTPRKWFWKSKNNPLLKLTGKNFNSRKKLTTTIPSVYAIVADAIDAERNFSLTNKEDRIFAMNFCNFVQNRIDPHINNFMVEKGTNKIVLIDTEHFPSIVGLQETVKFKSYTGWYAYLVKKCFNDMFFPLSGKKSKIKKI